MINIHTNPVVTPPKKASTTSRRTAQIEPSVATPKDDKVHVAQRPFVERRRGDRDRRQHSADRGPFDMRGGRDRRKNRPGHPSVETDV